MMEQIGLLECMLDVCQEHTVQEIMKAWILSIMVGNTSDVSTKMQTYLVFQYKLNNCFQ